MTLLLPLVISFYKADSAELIKRVEDQGIGSNGLCYWLELVNTSLRKSTTIIEVRT